MAKMTVNGKTIGEENDAKAVGLRVVESEQAVVEEVKTEVVGDFASDLSDDNAQAAEQAKVLTEKDVLYNNVFDAKVECFKAKKALEAVAKDEEELDGMSETDLDDFFEAKKAALSGYEDAYLAMEEAEIAYLKHTLSESKTEENTFEQEFKAFEDASNAIVDFKLAKQKLSQYESFSDEALKSMTEAEFDSYNESLTKALNFYSTFKQANEDASSKVEQIFDKYAEPFSTEAIAEAAAAKAAAEAAAADAAKQEASNVDDVKVETQEQVEPTEESEQIKQTLKARIWNKIKSPFEGFMAWYRSKRAAKEQVEQDVEEEIDFSDHFALLDKLIEEEKPRIKAAEVEPKVEEQTNEEVVEQIVDDKTVETTEQVINDVKITNERNFVFDVDGTLVNENGAFRKGVPELFESILENVENPNIVFLSSGSAKKAKKVYEGIQRMIGKEFDAVVAGFNGKTMYDLDGNLALNAGLSKEVFDAVSETVKNVDPKAFVVGLNEEGGFYKTPMALSREEIKTWAFKLKGFGKLASCASEQTMQEKAIAGEFNAMAIAPYDKYKQQQILAALNALEIENAPKFELKGDRIVVAQQQSKWQFMQNFFSEEELKRTAYFGDGVSDIECLKNIDKSFAVGRNLRVLEAGKLPIKTMHTAREILFEDRDEDLYLLTKRVDYELVKQQIRNDNKAKKFAAKSEKKAEKGSLFESIKSFFTIKKQKQQVAEEVKETPEVIETPSVDIPVA